MSRGSGTIPVVTLLLLVGTLAGCIDEPVVDPEPEVPEEPCVGRSCEILDETGRDLRFELTAEDSIPAPTWKIGDVFQQHLYYGSATGENEHITTMVVDDSGDCYEVATTSEVAARNDAAYDLPILGCIQKAALQTAAFDVDWGWMYDFPLEDGKTWEGSVAWMLNWNDNSYIHESFTLTATYAPEIDAFVGEYPGFQITGTTDEGEVFLEYDFVPAVGWFAHFYMFDLNTEDTEDFMFHAMSMGTEEAYTGPYHIAEAEPVVEEFHVPPFSFLQSPTPPEPQFTVPEGAHRMMGIVLAIACPGTSQVSLRDPSGTTATYEHTWSGSDPMTCNEEGEQNPEAFSIFWYDEPSQAGEWQVAGVGAGIWGYGAWLVAVTDHQFELTDADLPSGEGAEEGAGAAGNATA